MNENEQIQEMASHCFFYEGGYCCKDIYDCYKCEDEAKTCGVFQTLENLHTAGYRKVERGHWTEVCRGELFGKPLIFVRCSVCGKLDAPDNLFCPYCGADMRGEDNA